MTLRDDLTALMGIPGLSGHEDRVRRWIAQRLRVPTETDTLGNLWATLPGDPGLPSVMLFAHMDQLGFIVRRIDPGGTIGIERMGGVPERALPAQEVILCVGEGRDVYGVIANKSHHATTPDEKYTVLPVPELYIDAGLSSAAEADAAGIRIGTPVVYAPGAVPMGDHLIAGPAIDDRAGCAVLIALIERLAGSPARPTIHVAFTVLEEFNLRGAAPLAERLKPDMAIQIDLMLASDTPDMAGRGEMILGGGPGISLYSFHGRGTLNGVIPHPAMVALMEGAAETAGLPLQRSASTGILTDLSYVQLTNGGTAAIDAGYPMRHSHSAREICDLRDLDALTTLLHTALQAIGPGFTLDRDAYTR
ncbi:M42 family metallopeptidase [Ovoidimarina sediminis]|uniref:M42 family metallopeptidase n=1 Tax=Ovoidimarina sediminis TaxID=3079856 RepID=UPI0029090ADF|nr:M20/M25/M40 family metallo-hydrolase [Rhodophyticola sp. MJ-SS7]MDU8942796.1 M20/M25/M40 family metallo-hydrolase [Rhodophyticola sp. MJ-SS7]